MVPLEGVRGWVGVILLLTCTLGWQDTRGGYGSWPGVLWR